MNKKTVIIAFIVFLILGSVITILFSLTKNKPSDNELNDKNLLNAANYSGADKKILIDNQKIEVNTEQGKVLINNVFSSNYNTEFNESGEPFRTVLYLDSSFNIFYIYDGDYFEANLLKEPLISTRQLMEQKFISLLGIQNKNDVCKIKTYVYIPYSTSKELGADKEIDYGFSWCPGAFVFTKQ